MKTALLAALVLMLCGCASSGTRIESSQLGEVRKGQTTVDEIIKKFGRPTLLSKNWDGTQTAAYANPDGRSDAGTLLPLVGVVAAGGSGVDSVIFYFDTRGVLTDFKSTQTAATRAEQASTPEPVAAPATAAAPQNTVPARNASPVQNASPAQNVSPAQNASPAQKTVTKPAPAPRPASTRSDGLPFWLPSEIRDPRFQ
jgi:outer membrane protein assembly factor BamE (lipoprotein component of BamABCDE complex)